MTDFHILNNIGYISHKFTNEELQPIRDEVSEIQNDFDKFEKSKFNYNLAGNIEKEYLLEKSREHISQLVSPFISVFENQFDYIKTLNYNLCDRNIIIDRVWVNFQKKYEFNPIHNHSGLLSFIIYLNVPFFIDDERKNNPGKYSNTNVSGSLSFLYTNALGSINERIIPVDKTYENVMFLFSSKLCHSVYPFYSSDDYRISVSGNFLFDTSY